ncbi:MAG: hypothetical protein ACF8XB_11030 [Planctomycetota bacterium JB042]
MPRRTNARPGSARRPPLETAIVSGIEPEPLSRRRVASAFRALLSDGARLRPAGAARRDPSILLEPPYVPRHLVRLFRAHLYLSDPMFDEALGFFVAFVGLEDARGRIRTVHPRIVYKDSSLVWRTASHFVHSAEEYWIGKGDTRHVRVDGDELLVSAEETTNLPYELQAALDTVHRRRKPLRNDDAVELVLREGPPDRVEPYADFTAPRRRADAERRIHGGRRVARFRRRNDPTSLTFARGYEPDFARGVVEEAASGSLFFGGDLRKFRIVSSNRAIQYQFVVSPTHAWVNPPQALTTELSTYAVRVVGVPVDDDLCGPGNEYHFLDEEVDPPRIHSQIPPGFAGAPHPLDPSRADAAAWIEAMPVVRAFRRRVLGERARRSG